MRILIAASALLALTGCGSGLAFLAGVPETSAEELQAALEGDPPPFIIDVSPEEEFRKGHVEGAIHVPMAEVDGFFARINVGRNQPMLFVCEEGWASVDAAARASAQGHTDVKSLAGGMARWRELGLAVETGGGRLQHPPEIGDPPRRDTTLLQQAVVMATAFGIKPLYMILALILILWLWKRKDTDLALARWGLVAFLAGEAACALNYLLLLGLCDPLELAHQLGMVVMGALLPWSLFALVDRRVLRFTEPEAVCAVNRLCKRCWKREEVGCGLHRLFLWMVPMMAILSLIPLTAPLRPLRLVLPIVSTDVPYGSTLLELLVQFRLYPLAAVVLFAIAYVLLRTGKRGIERSKLPFFLGIGLLAFSLLRFGLFETFRPMPIWADAWEEITELLTIVAAGIGLWVFRRQLGLRREEVVPDAGG